MEQAEYEPSSSIELYIILSQILPFCSFVLFSIVKLVCKLINFLAIFSWSLPYMELSKSQ